MADENSKLEALLARFIQDKLGQEGGLEELLRVVREVKESLPAPDTSGGGGEKPVRADTAFAGEGTLRVDAHVVVPPMTAVATFLPPTVGVFPDKGVDAIRSAIPELADEIQARGPIDRTAVINMFVALINLLAALVTLHATMHPAAPVTPQQITQFFDQSVHIVNQTTVVSPPPQQ